MVNKYQVPMVVKEENFVINYLKLKKNYLPFHQKKGLLSVRKKVNQFLRPFGPFGLGLKNFSHSIIKNLAKQLIMLKIRKSILRVSS